MIAYTSFFTRLYQFPFQRAVLQLSGNSQSSKNDRKCHKCRRVNYKCAKNQSTCNYMLCLWTTLIYQVIFRLIDCKPETFYIVLVLKGAWLQHLRPTDLYCSRKPIFLIYRIQFNSEEQWTKALKYMLTNLKWGLAWVSSQFANKWQLGVVTSIPTFIYLLNTVKNSHLIMIKNCDTLCVCHVLIKERLCFSCIVSMILYLKKEINILIPLFSNWLTDQLHMCTVLYKP